MSNSVNLLPVYGIATWTIVMLVVLVILIAGLVALSIYGKKLQDRQESSQRELENAAQSASMLVIDKKRMKLNEAGLPAIVLEQTPKYMRGRKVPIVKGKIGPRIMSFICDEKIFDIIPVKKEVKATISGIYIMDVKGVHTNLEARQTKLKWSDKMRKKMDEIRKKEDSVGNTVEKKNKKKK